MTCRSSGGQELADRWQLSTPRLERWRSSWTGPESPPERPIQSPIPFSRAGNPTKSVRGRLATHSFQNFRTDNPCNCGTACDQVDCECSKDGQDGSAWSIRYSASSLTPSNLSKNKYEQHHPGEVHKHIRKRRKAP